MTVGVFDGVHRGHQRMLEELRRWAAEDPPGDAVVVTFATHPRAVLGGGAGPPLLTSVEHRVQLLGEHGADGVVVLDFDRDMASWTPREFVERVFVRLGATRVLVGENHRFGKDRAGDLGTLQALGAELGFRAREVALVGDDEVVSSTAIRERLAQGDLPGARALLGREVKVLGTVVAGEQRGRTLGFPTANLDLAGAARPGSGVYAARARVPGAPWLPAVVNVGRRPTFHPEANVDLVEVHLLAGGRDLYGRRLEVWFVEKLRDEARFAGPEALKAQIQTDIERARELLLD
ncbi:MAG: riboflavin biosynthesis protein RibF [Planctomycetota bacterium]